MVFSFFTTIGEEFCFRLKKAHLPFTYTNVPFTVQIQEIRNLIKDVLSCMGREMFSFT